MEPTKFLLDERSLPESWYNVVPDLPFGLALPLNPATREPVGPEVFAEIFPEGIIRQEMTAEPYVDIPEEVREIYALWRPTPLFRARRLEKALDTPPTFTTNTRAAPPWAATNRTPPSPRFSTTNKRA